MSINQTEELKLGETINAIKLLSTSVLIGVQKALDRYGEKHNIPPSLRTQLISGIQTGGQGLIGDLKTAKNLYDMKKMGSEKLKDIGLDAQTINMLRNAKNVDDFKRIGLDKLKKIGITEDQLRTLNRDQLKQMGMSKLKQSGILDKMGLSNFTNEQLGNINPNGLKKIGTDKLKQYGERIGISEDEFKSINNPENPDNEKGIVSLVASKSFSNAKNITVSVIKKIIIVTDFFVSRIIDYVTGSTLNTPISELTSNTNVRVLALAAYLRAISNDPEQLKAISEISESIGIMGIEFIDSIKPAVDKIVEKLNETSQKVASQAASGAMKTFIAISSSLIAEIPGLGGIIDLVISLAIGFNSIMRVVRTFVTSNSEVFEYGADALNNSLQTVKRSSGRLVNSINTFKEGISTNASELNPVYSNEQMTGGGKYTLRMKSNSNKMSKSRKRIENSVHRFKNHRNDDKKYLFNSHSRTKKSIHY